jgi:hypothetical protein
MDTEASSVLVDIPEKQLLDWLKSRNRISRKWNVALKQLREHIKSLLSSSLPQGMACWRLRPFLVICLCRASREIFFLGQYLLFRGGGYCKLFEISARSNWKRLVGKIQRQKTSSLVSDMFFQMFVYLVS